MKQHLIIFITLITVLYSCKSSEIKYVEDVPFVVSDFTDSLFTSGIEGPAWRNDTLFVVNYAAEGTIGYCDKNGNCGLYVTLPSGSTGNAIRFDSDGNMLIADYSAHHVLRIPKNTRNVEIVSTQPLMNQPNDIAVSSTNIIYASDPKWADNTGQLWRVDLNGTTTLLEGNMGTTNGIEISPDGKTLYVNESVQRNVWKYNIAADGSVSGKTLLIQFPDFGMDGMKCDNKGNLYIARYGKGVIAVVSPKGKLLKEIKLQGIKPTNIVFGGSNGKRCFVTLQERGVVEVFTNDIAGKGY